MAKTALGLGLALGVLTALTVLGYFSSGMKPGFITPDLFVSQFNLALQILLVLGLTFGAWLARSGRTEAHRVNQTIWVLVNAALVFCMMLPAMWDAKITQPSDLADPRIAFSWIHATIGACTVASGLWLVLQMNDILPRRFHIRRWKRLMRFTLAGYWTVAILGFVTYYFAFY